MRKMISLPFESSTFSAYHTYPETKGKHPALIVIHEVWGLKDHIKDVADRFANEGYSVLAPDLLSETGVTEKVDQTILAEVRNPETRDEAQKKLRAAMAPIQSPEFGEQTIKKLKACIDFLLEDEHCDGNIAVIGFCFGGTYAYALACEDKRLNAIVPFYGHAPTPLENVKNIDCPVLAFYGKKDENLMNQLPEITRAMQTYEKNFESVVYPNTGHAFFNDTNPTTYNKDAAEDSWAKTLEFLSHQLA